MSVINKMLKDLEQKQQPETQSAQTHTVTKNSHIYKIIWLLVFIILVLLIWNFKSVLFGQETEETAVVNNEVFRGKSKGADINLEQKITKQNIAKSITKNKTVAKTVIPKNHIKTNKKNQQPIKKIKPEKMTIVEPQIKPEKRKPKVKLVEQTTENIKITKKETSPEQIAKNLWQQAELHPLNAEKLLRKALSLSPRLHGARLQLIALLVSQQRMSVAENIVDNGLSGSSENAAYIEWKARLRIADNDKQTAFQWLLKVQPEIKTHTRYYGLLAGVASQLDHQEKASHLYQQLVVIQPRHGPWLLGLAISMERLGKKTRAINLYKKAKLTQGLTARAQLFIQQKINKLER